MSYNTSVSEVLSHALTVRELIEQLQGEDQDAKVVFTCNYGDYHNTQQALTVNNVEEYTEANFATSAYSQSGIAQNDKDAECEFFCPKCETERAYNPCPVCNATCLDEEGDEVEATTEETCSVVVLSA